MTLQERGGKYCLLIIESFIFLHEFKSNTLYLFYIQWHISICFRSICAFPSRQNSSQKMLNAETVNKVKIKHGFLAFSLCFGAIQNHIAKVNMLR